MIGTDFRLSLNAYKLSLLAAFTIATLFLTTPGKAQDASAQDSSDYEAVEALQRHFSRLADELGPSVVAVHTESVGDDRHPWRRVSGHGSGIVLTTNGFILTNEHVVSDGGQLTVVLFNGADYPAKVVGTDRRRDLAVIKIDHDKLRPATFGRHDNVRTGYWTLSLGNPYGISNQDGKASITVGIVSALRRNLTSMLNEAGSEDRYYGNLIQTSTPIHPGNSGGPLFDLNGHVTGIVVAVASRSDITEAFGFAIPITDHTLSVIERLKQGVTIEYGMLGAAVMDLAGAELRELGWEDRRGARIDEPPDEGTAAALAGLRLDDVIVEFAGTAIQDADHLVDVVGATPVGSTVNVVYYRNGQSQSTQVVVARRPVTLSSSVKEDTNQPPPDHWGGIRFAEPDPSKSDRSALSRDDRGLLVLSVRPGSPAHRAGLRELDEQGHPVVIMRANGQRVRELDEFRRAVRRGSGRIRLELSNGSTVIVAQ